jgi:hypothetical protein
MSVDAAKSFPLDVQEMLLVMLQGTNRLASKEGCIPKPEGLCRPTRSEQPLATE